MAVIVQKYGGTSVGSPERIGAVADRVAATVRKGDRVAVVVSAMGHSTDELVTLANKVARVPNRREMDALLATGEQVSIALVAMALQERGVQAQSMTGWQAGIYTEPVHGAARIEAIDTTRLLALLEADIVPVIAGFQGIHEGEITTLGRGGSDTTAVAVAAALQAQQCEIYTDVEGVYTADPRIVPKARKLSMISYEEMLELATLGSQVLHPRAVETAKQHGVQLVVRSSFTQTEGTVIRDMETMEGMRIVTGVATEKEVARIAVLGIPTMKQHLSEMFTALAKEQVNVDVIVQSVVKTGEVDVSFTVSEADVERAIQICEQLQPLLGYREVLQELGLSKVSIVGAGMITNPGVAAQMFAALEAAQADVKMVSTSEIKVSCIIPKSHLHAAVNQVHQAFEL
ncbi:aspartate kinase [Sulfoacidibacillus thermotolerans]|uniref:Aspartokinase n=1 Tax=Sulfoacidibacillus thermotolerans TaxID=1765684 RepID=A0A2U3D9W8_SULT2|nr:aspartate kinase [Sulfoacidibacillus thermotolerans]PWI58065.1 aspartate kinase [Sulfoacidibacillus thermotolerans]